MKLYYSPDACSIGIHVILEEIGKPYELAAVDLKQGEQYKQPFNEINPKSKVPVLERNDGKILTEFPAIAFFLGRAFPDAKLLPRGVGKTARALELIDYMVATVHMRGFSRLFRPALFTPSPEDEEQVKQTGRGMVTAGLDYMASELKNRDYLLGDISIADAALFFIERWAAIRAGMDLPPALAVHLQRMNERPAVRRVLLAEGLA